VCRCGLHGCTGTEHHQATWLIPHVKGRRQEAVELVNNPNKKARRWVVEVAHSWFNRFRKLLVRYEKLERSFIALNHLVAFRKVPLKVNIITDKF
jgi:putative transposase